MRKSSRIVALRLPDSARSLPHGTLASAPQRNSFSPPRRRPKKRSRQLPRRPPQTLDGPVVPPSVVPSVAVSVEVAVVLAVEVAVVLAVVVAVVLAVVVAGLQTRSFSLYLFPPFFFFSFFFFSLRSFSLIPFPPSFPSSFVIVRSLPSLPSLPSASTGRTTACREESDSSNQWFANRKTEILADGSKGFCARDSTKYRLRLLRRRPRGEECVRNNSSPRGTRRGAFEMRRRYVV